MQRFEQTVWASSSYEALSYSSRWTRRIAVIVFSNLPNSQAAQVGIVANRTSSRPNGQKRDPNQTLLLLSHSLLLACLELPYRQMVLRD